MLHPHLPLGFVRLKRGGRVIDEETIRDIRQLSLHGFASNTPCTVDITAAFGEDEPITGPQNVTTDDCGSADISPFVFQTGSSVRAEVDGVSSGAWVPIAC